MTELFEKVYIKTEYDLPKESGFQDTDKGRVNYSIMDECFINRHGNTVIIHWYLRPVEQKPDCYPKKFVEWMFSKQQVFDHQTGEWVGNLDYAYIYWQNNIKDK